jgi:hypothetical protein
MHHNNYHITTFLTYWLLTLLTPSALAERLNKSLLTKYRSYNQHVLLVLLQLPSCMVTGTGLDRTSSGNLCSNSTSLCSQNAENLSA